MLNIKTLLACIRRTYFNKNVDIEEVSDKNTYKSSEQIQKRTKSSGGYH